MKNSIKDKFKSNVLVKPLYKLKNRNKIQPNIIVSVDRTFELDGHGVNVKTDVVNHSGKVLKSKDINKRKRVFLCNECESFNKVLFAEAVQRRTSGNRDGIRRTKMLDVVENTKTDNINADRIVNVESKTSKLIQANDNLEVPQKTNTWLRLYPLPKLPEESIGSVIFRCVLCQLGLATILVLWTCVWTFVIHSLEGPYELKISMDFEKAQNQLVIDLATELRQITPLSLRWKAAIEQRIEQAKLITTAAVTRGAKPRPGQYWDLSGTFLFTVYVMTALGFGAPVPQTIAGKSSALIYACLAVPTHIYLLYNASICIVVHIESYMTQMKCRLRNKKPFVLGKTTLDNESPNCSRNSELLKASSKTGFGRKIMRVLGVFGACRSVPLAGVLYYVLGACIFGVLQDLSTVDLLMFPLEFTTNRHLENIPGHMRLTYAFYVEGAMLLIACGLTTLRLHSSSGFARMSEKYRLFATAD